MKKYSLIINILGAIMQPLFAVLTALGSTWLEENMNDDLKAMIVMLSFSAPIAMILSQVFGWIAWSKEKYKKSIIISCSAILYALLILGILFACSGGK
jgi:hypothetical protein